ncbi:MAG: sulfotransferase [Cytophagales bacterium]|nr:sulfotransferase [Cytophagales bacterium]
MYPDVIYIGAPRAGSTWIWENLSQHPDTWTLPYKSVEYLNDKASLRRRKNFKINKEEIFKSKSLKSHLWDLHYFFYPFTNDHWYQRLFKSGTDKIKIDIAPSCIRRSPERIISIHNRMPNARLLLALRNPVERTWSHAMQHFIRNKKRKLEDISHDELMIFFEQPNQYKNGCYAEILERWESTYPSDQIYVYFFEDILTRPDWLLQEICAFLGLEHKPEYFDHTLRKAGNYTGVREISEDVESYLYKKFEEPIRTAQQRFKGYTDQWLINLENRTK